MIKNLENKKVGLALGSGSAKGLAHIGVLKFLQENNIKVDYISGTSIGAMIGGAYAAGIDAYHIENIALSADYISLVKYFFPTISKSGLINGIQVEKFLENILGDLEIEDLKIPFTAVTTNIKTGQEFLISKGNLIKAIRSSISVPIIFKPTYYEKKYLIDGGLVNPLPIKTVYDMGASYVIAVNVIPTTEQLNQESKAFLSKYQSILPLDNVIKKIGLSGNGYNAPNIKKIGSLSINITQRKLSQISIELYKPDILLEPNISFAGFFDYYKAQEIIDQGYKAIQKIFEKEIN
jgi:NTE family protein